MPESGFWGYINFRQWQFLIVTGMRRGAREGYLEKPNGIPGAVCSLEPPISIAKILLTSISHLECTGSVEDFNKEIYRKLCWTFRKEKKNYMKSEIRSIIKSVVVSKLLSPKRAWPTRQASCSASYLFVKHAILLGGSCHISTNIRR